MRLLSTVLSPLHRRSRCIECAGESALCGSALLPCCTVRHHALPGRLHPDPPSCTFIPSTSCRCRVRAGGHAGGGHAGGGHAGGVQPHSAQPVTRSQIFPGSLLLLPFVGVTAHTLARQTLSCCCCSNQVHQALRLPPCSPRHPHSRHTHLQALPSLPCPQSIHSCTPVPSFALRHCMAQPGGAAQAGCT